MNWLFKEEPTHYSYDDLVRDGKTSWTGVRNPLAQKHLRSGEEGRSDLLLSHGRREGGRRHLQGAAATPIRIRRTRRGKLYAVDVGAGEEARSARSRSPQIKADKSFAIVPAGPDAAPVGDAGHRRGVGADRGDERDKAACRSLTAARQPCPCSRLASAAGTQSGGSVRRSDCGVAVRRRSAR